MATVVAGALQWVNMAPWLDDTIPLVVLGLGLLLSGRVAADVAQHRGSHAGVAAGFLVFAFGLALSWATEAHGDGVEPQHAVAAGVVVTATTGGTAWLLRRRRAPARPTGPDP